MLRNLLRRAAQPRRHQAAISGRRQLRLHACRLEQCEQRLLLTFHLWKIDQVFSSPDGKTQFIELSDPANGENHLAGHFISSNENKFTFPADLPSDATANHHFLIGTASYAALPGAVKPDYIIPDNFFNPQADTFDYADVDGFSFAAGQEPTDGKNSLFRDVNSGALTTGLNSETNLAGQTGSVTATTSTPTKQPPTLAAITNPAVIPPSSGQQTVALTGISAGANTTQPLTITATSDNPALIPNPTVNYTAPNSSGTLTYTPVAGAQGTADITVTATDDGGSATRTFKVQVASANQPPVTTPPTTTPPVTTPPTNTPQTSPPPSSAQDQVFVQHLYEDLLGRNPVGSDDQPWLSLLASGTSQATVAKAILDSPEHLHVLVNSMYQKLLGRTAETQGLDFWTNQLMHGSDESTVRARIAASDEFFNRAGGTNDGFLAALYQDLLGRGGDAPSVALWQSQLAGGATRNDIAQGFVKSSEFHGLLVNDPPSSAPVAGWYQTYFHRAADQAGASFFAAQLDHGTSLENVQLEMLASDEYLARA